MFNTKTNPQAFETNAQSFAAHVSASDANCSIINEWLTMRGDLESQGDILVKGKVFGNITCKLLIVDGEAMIDGGIQCDDVIIRGTTRGIIKAKRVRLERTANVEGEIHQTTFSAEEGAKVRGALFAFVGDEKASTVTLAPVVKVPASTSPDYYAPVALSVVADEPASRPANAFYQRLDAARAAQTGSANH